MTADRIVYLSETLGNRGPAVEYRGDGSMWLRWLGEAVYLDPDVTAALVQSLHYRFDCDWPDCPRVGIWSLGDLHLCREHTTDYRARLGRPSLT